MKIIKCYRCGQKRKCTHLVLVNYSSSGGWVEDGMYCNECGKAIASFMRGE